MRINRIHRTAIKYQSKQFTYPEVWGYIRRNQTASSFECDHCGQSFPTHEQLRRHEVDCIHDR
jgi:hypothetical protein